MHVLSKFWEGYKKLVPGEHANVHVADLLIHIKDKLKFCGADVNQQVFISR